ncbi:S-layer homology domain-containing protein [Paenibacillus pinisoli]|nr:S-layer homology domain-containing protein [Paenibacillus pinisoli]
MAPEVIGDERYIFDYWETDYNGGISNKENRGVLWFTTSTTLGLFDLNYYFKKQVWDGSVWVDTDVVDIKTTHFLVSPWPVLAPSDQIRALVEPSTTINSGSSFTVVAEGVRQFEEGVGHGDQKIIPDKWRSSESGNPEGSFALDSENRYTSVYTPSSSGVFTVTVIFKELEYNGYSKEWKEVKNGRDLSKLLGVIVESFEADKFKNKLTLSSTTINVGEAVTLTAEGDSPPGSTYYHWDTRYIPTTWSSTELGKTGSFTLDDDGSYTAQYAPGNQGRFEIDVKFMLQRWYDGRWNDQYEESLATSPLPALTVNRPPAKTANPDNNSLTASPSEVSLGGSVTLTAKGDREEASTGNTYDERFVPISWTSEENGKSGTFTKDSNGNYTSAYTPSAAGSYDVTATFHKEMLFDGIWYYTGTDMKPTTVTVTVPTEPTEASPGNNSVSANPSSVTAGIAVTLTAEGDRQSAEGVLEGDERYVPVGWSSTENGKAGTFTKDNNGSYISDYTPASAGTYTVTATFQLQKWDGTAWSDVSGATDMKTATVTATAAPEAPEANAGNNSVSANPGSVIAGATVTLTAVGDRQSADGAFVGYERYMPVSWSSTESGKMGTFTKDNNGKYTSDYMTSAAGSYTITALFQKQAWNGISWVAVADATDTKMTTVTVTAIPEPTEADADNNSVSASPSSVTAGTAVSLTAEGDRQSADGTLDGDERYVPVSWSSTESGKTGTFAKDNNDKYTSTYTPSAAGTYTVTATFQMQTWNGTAWVSVTGASNTKTTTVTVTAAPEPEEPTEADADNNSVSASPSSVTAGTAVTLTASGDRQSADGELAGDERYVPVSWSSTESGKIGNFTKDNDGKYTSAYTPSAPGTYTVTATFQMQAWNGTAWVSVTGASNTKTTTVTVTAAPEPEEPTEADADNNSVSASPSSVKPGATVTLTAEGDRQSADGELDGDERYVPVSWSSTESGKIGNFTKDNDGKYTSAYTPSAPGTYTVTATFQMQTWNGTAWVSVTGASNTKTTTVTVTAAPEPEEPTEADADNNSVNASPSSVKPGATVTLTAEGDRQSADGELAGDERYVPVSWNSTESGKLGTFTKDNNGKYSAAYKPSAAGSYTVTAIFQKETWNGTAWVAVAGATNTKTTQMTVTAVTESTEANPDNNIVGASPSSVTPGTAATLTAVGDRESEDGAFAGDERYLPVSWSSTESGKTGTFTKGNNGKYTAAYRPSSAGTYTVTATFQKQTWNGTAWVDIAGATDTKTIVVTVRNGGSTPSTPQNPSEPIDSSESETGVIVLVNGKAENAGIAKPTTINGQSAMIIIVDQKKIEDKLAAEGFGAVVTVPVKTNSDIVVAQLNGELIQEMEDLQATLVVKTDRAIYTVPSVQINMNELSKQFGTNVSLQDITVELQFGSTPADMAKIVEQSATKGSFTPVMPAMDFIVKGTYGDKTVEISTFSVYVERAIAIPDGVDHNKITTGVVVDPDGTSRHVPTKITVIDGRYYAVINSLTNSTYSVVWHPLEFSDVEKHWAKDAVNDMGSRMVASGTGNGKFSPNRDITRAEFVAIIVRGLGLKPSKEAAPFTDVHGTDWYNTAISTAVAYQLIDGFGDGTFRPNDKITREQAMVIVVKAMKITGLSAKLSVPSAESLLDPFADAAAVSDWARSSSADSIQAGIIMGRSAIQLAPKAYITRAEVATVIQRLLRKSDLI